MTTHNHQQSHGCSCCNPQTHEHHSGSSSWKRYLPCLLSFAVLFGGILIDNFTRIQLFDGYLRLAWYLCAYLPVGIPVLREAYGELRKGSIFNEFSLMSIASIGAFCIGEYPEGVAVMLFYSFGELLQDSAVERAQRNIKALLDIRPDVAVVLREGAFMQTAPAEVEIGERIRVKAGERVPLDSRLLSESSSFNTAALTGESMPRTLYKGDDVLAGMVNLDKVIELEVKKRYENSSIARILALVEEATSRKAKTELLIRRLAKVYTPIVFLLALLITLIPYFVVGNYVFADWLYRGLVFLVISCPCALVVSIPLSYFGGIGAASRHGILFKGANYLDHITKVNTIMMDKTGTLTKGIFKVQHVETTDINKGLFMDIVASVEAYSTHPIAKAIGEYHTPATRFTIEEVEEFAGKGLKAKVNGQTVFVGNTKLMKEWGISYNPTIDDLTDTVIVMSIDNVYKGYVIIADEIKEDAKPTIEALSALGIRTIMLSGDNKITTQKVADILGINVAKGNLLPEEKAEYVGMEKADANNVVAYVGDGINDAPVLALSDVGIAMGGAGSDAAIEIADVVIQNDNPSRIITAIRIGKATQKIVKENIIFVFAIKAAVIFLGAVGLATMWAAVFADVGAALIAILNAIRILHKRF